MIVGPGNLYVQEAKHQLSAIVGIDGFAGPSDLLVVLGAGSDARVLRSPRWTCSPRPSTARAASSSPRRLDAALARRARRELERLIVERPTVGRPHSRW